MNILDLDTNRDLITPPPAYRGGVWDYIISTTPGYWFSKSTMRFFKSRILWATLTHDNVDGVYFISSEDTSDPFFSPNEPRLYTLRHWEDGNVSTVGEFRQYATRSEALAALRLACKEVN